MCTNVQTQHQLITRMANWRSTWLARAWHASSRQNCATELASYSKQEHEKRYNAHVSTESVQTAATACHSDPWSPSTQNAISEPGDTKVLCQSEESVPTFSLGCVGSCRRLQLKCDGTRWRTGAEVEGKLANGVGSQYPSHYLGTWCIQHYYHWCAHLGCQ